MAAPLAAEKVLNREFFELRRKILELAASLDRMDRGEGAVAGDPRLALLFEAIDVLKDERSDRAEQVQLVFSRPYNDDWQTEFGM